MDQLGLGSRHAGLMSALAFVLGARFTLPPDTCLVTLRPTRSGIEMRLDVNLDALPDPPAQLMALMRLQMDAQNNAANQQLRERALQRMEAESLSRRFRDNPSAFVREELGSLRTATPEERAAYFSTPRGQFVRSLNLSSAASATAYEALRQCTHAKGKP